MDTTNQPPPHLALRTAKKLNPKLIWRMKRTIADSIMKTPASLPGCRKPQGFSNPQLVAMRRDYFRRLAKAKLLNTPDAPAVEAYLKRLDEELARRKITIQDPELT